MPFYAVRVGRTPGIYPTWDLCQEQVLKFGGAQFKKFNSKYEAESFMNMAVKQDTEGLDNKRNQSNKGNQRFEFYFTYDLLISFKLLLQAVVMLLFLQILMGLRNNHSKSII